MKLKLFTYLIDSTLNILIIRLGDILLLAADDDLRREAVRLDNNDEWMKAKKKYVQKGK